MKRLEITSQLLAQEEYIKQLEQKLDEKIAETPGAILLEAITVMITDSQENIQWIIRDKFINALDKIDASFILELEGGAKVQYGKGSRRYLLKATSYSKE